MSVVTATDFRKNMAQYVQQVAQDHKPVIITTQSQGSTVLVSLEDWESLNESLYLTASTKNKKRLDAAVIDIRAGQNVQAYPLAA